jgi:hydrogenase nickel incorporation protein HypA/HybF
MHEYSVVSSLIASAEARAREHGALAIHRLWVRIGELSGVDPDLLVSAFELARLGTFCADAALDVERIPVAWACRACGTAIELGEALRCGVCGAPARLVAGDEIVLARMELEMADV